MAKQKFSKWLSGKKNIMNLEEKAKNISNQTKLSDIDKTIFHRGIKIGYKLSISDCEEIAIANPKMSANDLVNELKKLL